MIKKVFLFISMILITNIIFANTPPTIFNFRIESSEPNKVFFDSDKPITGSSADGFTISNRSISSLSVNSGQLSNHYFTVSDSFTFWDNNTIRYEGGSNIKDENGNTLHEFTLSYIKNNIPEPETSKDRYVTTSASGGGDGTSEDNAWTWEEAFSNANAGTTVWIKAGDYGDLNLAIYNDGTSVSPIKFIGYKESIGDITSNYFDYGREWDSSEMPTLTGSSPDDGVAILPMGIEHVIFRNLQISNYSHGIQATTTFNRHLVFDRINGYIFGSTDSSGGSAYSSFINFETYNDDPKYWDNKGPFSGNDHMKFLNLRCLNAGLAALYVVGDGNNLIDGCKTYSDRIVDLEVMDYQIAFNGHNNIVRNCYVENFNTTHSNVSTHGIGVRGDYNHFAEGSTYNLIEKSKAVNINEGFYFRNYGSNYNVIKDCEVSNNANGANYLSNGHEDTGGVVIWGGSDYNIIERVTVNNTSFGIIFYDNQEDKHPSSLIGKGNQIRNCVFNKTRYMMILDAENSKGAILEDTKIINCTFNDAHGFMKNYYAVNSNLEMINCQITNQNRASAKNPATDSDPNMNYNGVSFKNCNFFGNTGNWHITDNGNTNVDPQYISESDLHLSSSSPDEVTEGGIYERLAAYDIENKFRGDVFSIGAYQYGESTTGSIRVDAGEDTEICSGEKITLTATGNGDFSWNTGETTASITVNPEETTTYTVTVSDGENSKSDEVIVTVKESSSVDLGDDITIAPGEEAVLTATGTGDFLWSTGETTESITVSPNEDTIYTVTASSCGDDATDEVKVSISGVNAGKDETICSGDEVILTATGNGDFSWNTGETTASITVKPTETTTYTVTLTNKNSSVSDEVLVTVNESSSVNLGEDITINSGEEVKLTAEGTGNFLWSTGETSESITVSPTEDTTYSVTSSACGEDATDEIKITVNKDDTGDLTVNAGEDKTICSGEEITLSATGNGDFSWNTGETTASITVSPTENTTYTVTATRGDKSVSDEVNIIVNGVPNVDLGEDQSICYGEEVVLEVESSGDFLWSTGSTSNRIRVKPTETTTYTVTVTSSCGAAVTDEITINVGEQITVDAGVNKTICTGESVVLTATGSGNYKWSTGETTASITVSPNIPKTYWVTSWSGDCSVSDNVFVNVEKAPIVKLEEDKTICAGDQITLIAQGTGNFLWSTGERTSSILVSPTENTVYSVTASSHCNESAYDEMTVIVFDTVTANAGEDVTIESGDTATLTASGGNTFLWSTGETTASISVQPNETTKYSVEVSNTGGSCKSKDAVLVNVVDIPLTINDGEDITICVGDELILQAKGSSNYLWNTGAMDSSISVKPTETTTYNVSAQKNGVLETVEVTVLVEDCSINKKDEFNIYPNPSKGLVNIHLPSQKEKLTLSVISINGKIIFNKEIKADSNGVLTQIDLSNMPRGLYLLRMNNNNFNQTKKIMIN